ncbi:MAG: hypothetical protein ABIE23_03810 [archaeon]
MPRGRNSLAKRKSLIESSPPGKLHKVTTSLLSAEKQRLVTKMKDAKRKRRRKAFSQ